jgi:hypothetical protein
LFAVIDFHGLFQVIWVSIVASISATVLFSTAVFGFDKAGEARRGGASGAAAYSALAIAALVLFGAAVVFGVTVMLSKD